LDACSSSRNIKTKRFFFQGGGNIFVATSFFKNSISERVTLAKGIKKSTLNGLLTGSFLATTTLLWLNSSNALLLPILVALWWLVIFGCNLLHAYNLSNYSFSNTKRFGLQLVHAAVAAGMYWAIDFTVSPVEKVTVATQETVHAVLEAGIMPRVYHLLNDTTVIVPAAFILSLVTSGLLFSILTRPSAK